MPLVFVHGVNVRDNEVYRREVEQRNNLLLNIFSPLAGLNITGTGLFDAYWGDLAPAHRPGDIYLPRLEPLSAKFKRSYGKLKGLGKDPGGKGAAPESTLAPLRDGRRLHAHGSDTNDEQHDDVEQKEAEEEEFLELSHERSLVDLLNEERLGDVIDGLIAFVQDERAQEEDGTEQFAQTLSVVSLKAVQLSEKLGSMEAQRSWLKNIRNDEELLSLITDELDSDEGLPTRPFRRSREAIRVSRAWLRKRLQGARDKIVSPAVRARMRAFAAVEAARQKTRQTTSRIAARALINPTRQFFHSRMANFIGDSFYYFGSRGDKQEPGRVPARVMDVLVAADRARTRDDNQLIVIAHSMGGIVMCDVVSHFKPPVKIDCLITVGSQFPLFADLGMFPGLAQEMLPLPRPDSVNRWFNVVDTNDFLGFAAGHLFEGIDDFEYASGKVGAATHADYFKLPSFYKCMAAAFTAAPQCARFE